MKRSRMSAATGEYDDAVLWNDNLLPICPNMIGGILLGLLVALILSPMIPQ